MQINKPAGGAAIADRFKLDVPAKGAAKSAPAGSGAMLAVVIGLVALAVAGFLSYKLYDHATYMQEKVAQG